MGQPHRIDYIEFPVRDIERSKHFYAAAFGWEFTDYGDSYTGIRLPGSDVEEMGGFSSVDEVTPGGPVVVLYSEELETTLASAREAGATVVREPYAFPGGRRFELEDPDGHRIGVWTPLDQTPRGPSAPAVARWSS